MEMTSYHDIETDERQSVFFFMLNAFLHARIDTENESDGDEEVNVYMAHLLESLVDGTFYTANSDNLASTPLDVFHRVELEDSDRRKVLVYRGNADHRLIAFGLFNGWGEHRSLYRRAFTPSVSYLEEAQRYYEWAALFSNRMPARYCGMTVTFEKIAARFDTYLDVLRHIGLRYFHFIERLSAGELFHLEKQANEAALPRISEFALNHMLDAYNEWKMGPTLENWKRFQNECEVYQELNPEFEPHLFKACAA